MTLKIDIHAHIFDLNFIPIAGIIRSVVLVRVGITMPDVICLAIERYFHRRTPQPGLEGFPLVPSAYAEIIDQLAEEFVHDLHLAKSPEVQELAFDLHTTDEISVHAANGQAEILAWLTHPGVRQTIKAHLEWFALMTKDYTKIAVALMQQYPDVALFICHDMDMENFYPLSPPRYRYAEQVYRMRDVVSAHPEKFRLFYAYDPKKDLAALKNALNDTEYIGVKVYPPSGYKPYNDIDPSINNSNEQLYTFCETNDVPIFAHCNASGMEAFPGSGLYSDPANWQQVLIRYPRLRLCLGHAGGEDAWFSPGLAQDENGYVQKVVELCRSYPNVYCDMGYFPRILAPGGVEALRANLLQLFAEPENEPYTLQDKLLYGSDWHMLMQEHGFRDYMPSFDQLFPATQFPELRQKFFSENAIRYLKL